MAKILGPGGGARDAAPQIPRTPQARDLREVGKSPSLAGPPGRGTYRMPSRQKPDGTVRIAPRGLPRFCQLKPGRCLTGQYLYWTKNLPTAQCWWCRYHTQTRDQFFKVCPQWNSQQKILWADVWKEAERMKSRYKIRDLLTDGRCSRAILDFLSTTDVGRLVPAEEDAGSEVSGWERRERRSGKRSEGWKPRSWVLGRNHRCSCPCPLSWRPQTGVGVGVLPSVLSLLSFCSLCCGFLSALLLSWDRPGWRAKGSLQGAALRVDS